MSAESDTPTIRLLLIDDHDIFLAGLRLLLEHEPGFVVVGEARNRKESLEAVRKQPDIILLDLDLGSESGTDLITDLRNASEGSRILLLTGVVDSDVHLSCICLGAMGVVHKLDAPSVLVKAIRRVHAGEVWLNRMMMAGAMSRLQVRKETVDPDAARIGRLTSRELEVVAALGEGRRNKEIGERLFISEKTVRHYFTSIFDKLGVSDRLELMIFAYQHDLAKLPTRQSFLTNPVRA